MFDKITQALDKPLARFSQTAERIEQLAATYNRVGVLVEEALEPRSLDDVAGGKSPNLRSLVARIDRTLDGADKIIRDEDLVTGIKRVVAKAETTMTDAQGLVKDLRTAAGKVDGFIDSADRTVKSVESAAGTAERTMTTLAESATSTLRRAEEAAGKLAGVLDAAASGEGTLGRMLNNPDLYDSLKDATQRLDKALAEFQLLAEKFRTEGIRLRL
jgi:phospholipid/cholesterol/gamma-HCH transport system substrate-binding protein